MVSFFAESVEIFVSSIWTGLTVPHINNNYIKPLLLDSFDMPICVIIYTINIIIVFSVQPLSSPIQNILIASSYLIKRLCSVT